MVLIAEQAFCRPAGEHALQYRAMITTGKGSDLAADPAVIL